jgi:acyl-homoserine-lactone acylase
MLPLAFTRSVILFSIVLLSACGGSSSSNKSADNSSDNSDDNSDVSTSQFDASIRWTEFGIPHIKADSFKDLGYGVGYAYAWDNICTLADEFVMIDGERSKYFGAEKTHSIIGSFQVTNRESDFAMKLLINDTKMVSYGAAQNKQSTDTSTGYAAGYNRYLNELLVGEHPGRHLACRNEPWLREISTTDMFRRYLRLAMLASSTVFRDGIANAAPPVGGVPNEPMNSSASTMNPLLALNDLPIGSNMYGLGPDATADGSSMLLANPHFPWYGPERLHAMHVEIPGVLNSMGVALHGVPAPLIAFNDKFAWSHTVSTAFRFTLYQLTLNPSKPTQYLYDNAFVDMTETKIDIEVLQANGSVILESRTLYGTRYGPMLIVAKIAPGVDIGWSNTQAYALRDANYENTRIVEQFIAWSTAKDLTEFQRQHREILAVPWVNTVAVGPDQPAYYADLTVVPNVPDEMLTASGGCAAEPIHSVIQQLVPGLPVLDGSQTKCAWRNDADSPQPGTFGVANLPSLMRDDYVHNCNDSYWLTNPQELLTGFATIIGNEDAERTLRTRLCIIQVQERLAGTDGLTGTKFTFDQLQSVVLGSRVQSAELARDTLIDSPICSAASGDVATACRVLSAWDMKTGIDSIGAHIWREFWIRADDANVLWDTPYSSADPVNTPRGLNIIDPSVQQALPDAVAAITGAGIALDARFGSVQYDVKNGEVIEMFGGYSSVGNFTISSPLANTRLTEEGYPIIGYGNSWVNTVQFKNGRVKAQGYLTYSQSTDPASPHYKDLTKAYAAKQWPTLPFYDVDIEAMKIREMRISE